MLAFGLAMALGVTILFGLAPALRASSVKPASALKGGEDPHSRRRLIGMTSTRYIATLLFEVRATDWIRLALPSAAILLAVIRAVRVDPVSALRAE